MTDLWRRVLTALVLLPIAFGAVVLGGWWFTGLVVIVALRAQWELYRLGDRAGLHVQKEIGLITGLFVVLVPIWDAALPFALLGALVLIIVELFRRNESPLAVSGLAIFGLFYPVLLAASVVHFRIAPVEAVGEAWAIWLVIGGLVAVWAADTAAYFVGRAWGKRPLFKRVSPKKTIEGTVGGVVGAVGMVLVLWLVVPQYLGWPGGMAVAWWDAVIVGLIGGIVGPLGDLIESLFKRSVDVKDAGDLLPGHGGMLDRIDAMIVAVPVMVVYLQFVTGIF